MKKFFVLLFISFFCIGLAGAANSQSAGDTKGMAMCDRIQKQGVCEEYRLNALTSADKQIIIKHCTSDTLCPDQNRVGRCLKNKDPDGVVFDKHYYKNVAEKDDWEPSFIEETCINNNGVYMAD